MEDVAFVHVLQRHRDLYEPLDDLRLVEWVVVLCALTQSQMQVASLAVAHHDIQDAVLLERVLVAARRHTNVEARTVTLACTMTASCGAELI